MPTSTITEAVKRRHLIGQRFFGALMAVGIFVTIWGAQRSTVFPLISAGQRVPILLFGIDAADKSQHTDTLMMTLTDPLNQSLSVISIPRDTRINLPGYLFNRVNEIFGYHMRRTGDRRVASNEVRQGIETIFSSDERAVRIPYYIQVDYTGFSRIIDLLGGVWVQVDSPMHYDDFAGGLHVHFDPGRYWLNGDDALRYVRFRGPTGDKGRIFRQQEFLRNVAKRFANPLIIFKFPKIVAAVLSSVNTNLSLWDALYLAAVARRLRSEDLGFYIVPGAPHGPYWQLKRDATDQLVARLFFGEEDKAAKAETIAPQANLITVNVWNASPHKGIALGVTKYLRRSGFDVVDWGTYSALQIPSRVIDRKGNIRNAQNVATALGIENYHSEPNPSALVDVEVVIGRDFNGPGSQ